MRPIMASLLRLRVLLPKEFRQLLRDPRMRFFVLVPPLIQLVIFAYAATFDVRNAQVAVVDAAPSAHSRALLHTLAAGGHFSLQVYADMAAARRAMDRGTVRAIVQFPLDFERSRRLQLVADGSDSNSALLIVGQLKQTLLASLDRRPPITVETRAWYNPNLDDLDFFIPGIIANVVLISTLILTAMTVIREREQGTLERLMVTPVARLEFLTGKMIAVAAVGLFDVLLITGVGVLLFAVPFRGSLPALVMGSLLFLTSTLGIGLLISSYARTQQQAMLTAIFIVLPAIILSGFAFPINNMPEPVQWLTYIDPLRYFQIILRDLFLKGGGLGDHLGEYAAMALIGLCAMVLSLWRVR
ncbi:MAG TPA: ABC transporter permease [Gammaproteobacteria bacterium]|nr:ABC transporter permease [Gammaproteobacteria bacterium]